MFHHAASERFRSPRSTRLTLLWSSVAIVVVAAIAGLAWFYDQTRDDEFAGSLREARIANDAFVDHTVRVVNHVGTTTQTAAERKPPC